MMAATIKKELQLLRRDPRVLVRLLVLPLAFIALFGMAFGQDHKDQQRHPMAVWSDPAAARGHDVLAALDKSGQFALQVAPSADAVRKSVADETFDVGLVIPADFDPARGHPAELVIDTAGPLAVVAPLEGSIAAIAARALSGGAPPPTMIVPTSPPGLQKPLQGLSAFQLTVPGNAVLFGFFIALTCALSFAEERRSGTGRRLLAAPVARWKLLVAKLLPYVVLGAIQVGLLFVVGALGFGMKIGGSIPALVVLTIGVAAAATGLGLLLAAVSTTEKQISSLGSVAILVMGLVGGCMLPRVLMPHAIQQLGLFVPHGWALDGYYTLLVRDGAGFADVAKQIAAVYGFAALFLVAGVRRFRFEQ
jgi:linearmycin/streptolysin S transport system permease protein